MVLSYAVVGDELVVRVPAYNEATQYADGAAVTFDVAVRDAEDDEERIEVVGRGRLAGPEDEVRGALPDEHWPADLSRRLIWVQVDSVHGEAEPAGDHVAAADPARTSSAITGTATTGHPAWLTQ